ncbi:hypothetical protein GOV03_00920 [Candidatus Woesearchaeota archaeon]|nr:hypothetical protein [Candidatus Woesearchaeota archaeon]
MRKRGQITVFIIIGIVVLFIFAGILYVSKMAVTDKVTDEGEPLIADVPLEFMGIKSFTENCLYDVGKKGLLILGQQGGYIYPELLGEFSVSKPTDSMGLNLEPAKVPYWHYNMELNNRDKIVFSSWQPELYYEEDPEFSIESQLGRYVDEKLADCLEDYAAFEKQGFEIEKGDMETEVSVGGSSVSFWLKMSLEAERGGADSEMDQFYVKVPLNLKHYYDVANKITEAETNFGFLETHGLNLLSIFSGTEMDKLPPMSAVTFELAPTVFWNEIMVEESVKRVLSSYVPMLRFLGSDNFYDFVYPDSQLSGLYQATYDQAVVNMRGAEDLDVSFDYFNWPIHLKTNSVDGVIKPFHFFVQYQMLMMGQQTYETNYDVSYPVLVSLRDSEALNGEGYAFVFSLEGNIRNNEMPTDGEVRESFPMTASRLACKEDLWDTGLLRTVVVDSFTGEPLELVRIGFTIPEQEECDIGFTNDGGVMESKYPSVYGGVVNFMKEDYLINFYPIDTYELRDQPGIIGYAAETYPEEVIEMHKFKPIKVSVKKKNLEKCLTPLVCKYTYGEGLATSLMVGMPIPYKEITCERGKEQCFFNEGNNLFLDEEPITEVEANGSISRYNDYYFTDSVKELSEKESAMVILKRVADLNPEIMGNEFSVTIDVSGEELVEVELVPGIYELSGNLYSDEELLIEEEGRCMAYDVVGWAKEECFTINETRMEKSIKGMMEWNTPSTYLKITPEDLYTSDTLEIYLLSQNLEDVPLKVKGESKKCSGYVCLPEVGCLFDACAPKDIEINGRVIEDLLLIGEMGKLSRMSDVRAALEPKFS